MATAAAAIVNGASVVVCPETVVVCLSVCLFVCLYLFVFVCFCLLFVCCLFLFLFVFVCFCLFLFFVHQTELCYHAKVVTTDDYHENDPRRLMTAGPRCVASIFFVGDLGQTFSDVVC